MYGLLEYDYIWLRYNLNIWNMRVQKNVNIEKIAFKVVQMKFLAMHITNQKLCFDIFMVWNLLNIFIFLFVTCTIIQSITSSEMCSLHLTHPSAHTPGAVGSQRCGAQGAVGGSVPCSRVSPQSWTIPAGAEIRTHNLGLQVRRPMIFT